MAKHIMNDGDKENRETASLTGSNAGIMGVKQEGQRESSDQS